MYSVFDSNDPKNPSFEDNFKMDLAATLKCKSVVDMLNKIDAWEYAFWFEKYKKSLFGPSMENHMLAQIAFVTANSFSKSNLKFDDFIYKVMQSIQDRMNQATRKMYVNDCFHANITKGMSPEDAKAESIKSADIYMINLIKHQQEDSQNASD